MLFSLKPSKILPTFIKQTPKKLKSHTHDPISFSKKKKNVYLGTLELNMKPTLHKFNHTKTRKDNLA